MEKIKRVKASQIPDATNIEGFKAFGIKENTDGTVDNVKVPMDLLQGNVGLTAFEVWNNENGGNKTIQEYFDYLKQPSQEAANYAQAQGDYAKAQGESIEDDLALKANHGYDSSPKTLKEVDDVKANHGYADSPKTLKEVEDDVEQLAYVKIKNEAVNGSFENGLTSPFSKSDGFNGESNLVINSSSPISGNYDARLTITTPATNASRPQLNGLNKSANIGEKIYLHFYAKILSGTPVINGVYNGATNALIYGGDVINGRNSRVIDVAATSGAVGVSYFDSTLPWDMQMDNFIRINLTETFGAGNEPTEEEMNLLISTLGIDSFEGEITIPAQKIMQWQLKLIRKNKNAIIALGGTII